MREFALSEHRVDVRVDNDIAYLSGNVDDWHQVVAIGYFVAAMRGIKNVVNDLRSPDSPERPDRTEAIRAARKRAALPAVDVVIVGGGVIGCGIARELSRLDLAIAVVEKESDVSMGASKANNGMIHPGHAVAPFTLKAELNVAGNALYEEWAAELNFDFARTGSLILAYPGDSKTTLCGAYLLGKLNGVPDIRVIGKKKIYELCPEAPAGATRAIYTPTTAYVDGFEVTTALAENAAANGVDIMLDTEVLAIDTAQEEIRGVLTNRGLIPCNIVIDAAGVHADEIAAMVDDRFYTIHPRRGVIAILDKNVPGPDINLTRARPFDKRSHSKGGGAQRTVSGNPLLGPSAKEIPDKEDTSVTREELDFVLNRNLELFPEAERGDIISYFAGIRAADYTEDFIIEPSQKVQGFIHCSAIQSPGLAAAPAIARRVQAFVEDYLTARGLPLQPNADFNPIREKPYHFATASMAERDRMIQKDPAYGNIICRCESVTEGEIVAAIHADPPALTFDGIKRRTRAGAGRCQAGFCGPKLIGIMARELGIDVSEVGQKRDDLSILWKESDRKHASCDVEGKTDEKVGA